jgi:hypothetical protein
VEGAQGCEAGDNGRRLTDRACHPEAAT